MSHPFSIRGFFTPVFATMSMERPSADHGLDASRPRRARLGPGGPPAEDPSSRGHRLLRVGWSAAGLEVHRDLDPPLLDGPLEPSDQDGLDDAPRQGDEAEEAQDVRQDSGRDEDRAREENDHAVRDRVRRQSSRGKLGARTREDAQTLTASEACSQYARDDDESDRRERANDLANLDEEDELDGRDDK